MFYNLFIPVTTIIQAQWHLFHFELHLPPISFFILLVVAMSLFLFSELAKACI